MADSIFTRILKREIPSSIVYEDELFFAIKDIHPKAPVHLLLITKQPYASLEDIAVENANFYAQLISTARKLTAQFNISGNYKLFMNVGPKVQEVPHFHMHILGGWDFAKEEATKEVTL